jgi:membrane dipeptidase
MRQTAFFNLHCDTLTAFGSLSHPDAAFSLGKLPPDTTAVQCCAIFIPDHLRGDDAIAYYERYRDLFYAECAAHDLAFCKTARDIAEASADGRTAVILTVEGGAVLAGDPDRIPKIKADGVSILTLVWNGENELGSGNDNPSQGLTGFGRYAVAALEDAGILIDVSHLNDRGFDDVCEAAQKPFLATHSNARAVTPHPRNLTDRQITEIISRGGLIGLNYYTEFLRTGCTATQDDVRRHVAHFLALGAEHTLALGSDFDGADVPPFLASVGQLPDLCGGLLSHGIAADTVRAIAWDNAMRFFQENL